MFTKDPMGKIFKNHFLYSKCKTRVKAFSDGVDSGVLKSWYPGVGWDHNGEEGLNLNIGIYKFWKSS